MGTKPNKLKYGQYISLAEVELRIFVALNREKSYKFMVEGGSNSATHLLAWQHEITIIRTLHAA
jgi:hypothetical protein